MRIEDAQNFKSSVRTALQKWTESKIDELMPGKAVMKTFAKNGLSNLMDMHEARIATCIDWLFILVSDKSKVIDSDTVIDNLAAVLKEMLPAEYQMGIVDLVVGNGEIALRLPQNFIFDMLVGNMGTIRFTAEDIKELKQFLN